MGVWIEIFTLALLSSGGIVTPLVGVWIEMVIVIVIFCQFSASLPSWECGLKF